MPSIEGESRGFIYMTGVGGKQGFNKGIAVLSQLPGNL